MISTLSVATYVCCFLATLGFLQEQGWRGIVPLHSTREDVERLVGPPMSNGITYDLRNERVTIGYSEGNCEHGAEWNIPPGRVTNIRVYLQTKVKLSDLLLDLSAFEKFDNARNRGSISYVSKERGISVSTDSKDEVFLMEYFPKASETHLRCSTIPRSLNNEELQYYKFDEYSNLSLDDENARLDNFAIRLQREQKSMAYILGYGRQTEVSGRTRRAKNYLVKKWQIPRDRIEVRIGGNAKNVRFELYLVPRQK